MVFSIPTYTTIGDRYEKKVIDERSKGKTFLVPSGRTGKLPDALIQKEFLSINEGDKYVDPGTADRRYRLEKKKKNITEAPFKYANFPQKPSGSGSYFGTMDGKPIPHETDYIVPRKGDKIEKKGPTVRPIYTAPSKKGSYGMVGTTFSSVGQDYVADFYDTKRMRERQEREASHKKMQSSAFKPVGRSAKTFDEAPNAGVSSCYTLTKPMPPRKPQALNKYSIVHKKLDTAWRPAGTIPPGAPIEYREDPYDKLDPRDPPKKRREEIAKRNTAHTAWKPNNSGKDVWYTTSIAFKKL